LHAKDLAKSHGDDGRTMLQLVAMLEVVSLVLSRALELFPVVVRTLGALYLASIELLSAQRQEVVLASYDIRLPEAARRMGVPPLQVCVFSFLLSGLALNYLKDPDMCDIVGISHANRDAVAVDTDRDSIDCGYQSLAD
jgi:hypothetical protein